MLVDALAVNRPPGATESTVVGPFWAAGSPLRRYGESIVEEPGGDALWVSGRVLAVDGEPLPGAEIDVWQNGVNRLYAVQDPESPEDHLRGRSVTRDDGGFAFLAIRPTPYPIPDDGPVGAMLAASARHPWRPAHIHVAVNAEGFEPLATHIFDSESEYLDSDAVFAVKPSLIKEFVRRPPTTGSDPRGFPAHGGRSRRTSFSRRRQRTGNDPGADACVGIGRAEHEQYTRDRREDVDHDVDPDRSVLDRMVWAPKERDVVACDDLEVDRGRGWVTECPLVRVQAREFGARAA